MVDAWWIDEERAQGRLRLPYWAVLVLLFAALVVMLWAGGAVGQTRVDLYDTRSNRTGSAVIDEKTGRVDLYDTRSNRTGSGQIDGKTGRIDFYDKRGNRTGSGQVTPGQGGRRR